MIIKNPLRSAIEYRDGIPVLPGHFPLVGHVPSFLHHMPETLKEGERTLGPLFWVRTLSDFWMLIWTERESFDLLKNKVTGSLLSETASDVTVIVGESMLTLDGAPHHHIRSAVKGTFSPRGLEASHIGKMTADMIEARVRDWKQKREITVLTETQELTLDVIFRIMGITVPDLSEWRRQYREMLLGALPISVELPGFPRYRSRKAQDWLNRRLIDLIEETRQQKISEGKPTSLIASMVNGRDDEGKGLSNKELIENFRLMLFAGHETTASIMAWVLITLAQRPDLWEALVNEAEKASAIPLSPADLKSYPVAEGLFREAARLYVPPHTLIRKTIEPITIREHRIPVGTHIGVCVTLLGRDPELYPDPDRFDPGRWKGRTPTPVETCPFGGGPHFCLGYHLAWMEVAQFALTIAREMTRAGLRPKLDGGPAPRPIYFPLTHPPSATKVRLH